MNRTKLRRGIWGLGVAAWLVAGGWAGMWSGAAVGGAAQSGAADRPEAEPPAAPAPAGEDLAAQQAAIAERFRQLEQVLARMAELSGVAAPDREALLKRAVSMSKERLIGVQLDRIVELLEKESLARAVENQESVRQDLEALLELLLSENRSRRIESEKARIRQYLKELNRLIKQQKSIEGRTAGTGDPRGLADEQGDLATQTGDLAEQIKANEEGHSGAAGRREEGHGGAASGKPQSPASSSEEGSAKDEPAQGGSDDRGRQPSPGEGGDQRGGSSQSPGGSSSGRSQDGSSGGGPSGSPGQPSGGNRPSSQSSSQPSAPSQSAHPARRRLEEARKRMRQAEEKLRQAERQGAVEQQEEAIRQLEEARAELERILRQLREEEIQRILTALEQRFARMLQMQQEVYQATKRLDEVPQQQRDRNHQIEASRLSRREAEIVLEADQAWNLLREDGTAVAFPKAVEQVREDMEQVVQRLARAKVGPITQGIEEDIIAALEEMLEALKQAIQDAENRQQPMPDMPVVPQDPPLVDVLAELKMIRALQMRVNRRTERYSKLIEGEQAERAELLEALDRLAERQAEIFRITRDLELGKNR